MKIVESLEEPGLLIDGVTEAVKHEIKKQEGGLLWTMIAPMAVSLIAPMAFSVIQPVVSSLINAVTEKRQEGGLLSLLALSLIMKALRQDGAYKSR